MMWRPVALRYKTDRLLIRRALQGWTSIELSVALSIIQTYTPMANALPKSQDVAGRERNNHDEETPAAISRTSRD